MAAFTLPGSRGAGAGPSMISPPPRSSSVQSIATPGKENAPESQRQQPADRLINDSTTNTTASSSHQAEAAAAAPVPSSSSSRTTRPAVSPLELASGSHRGSLGQRATSMSSLASKSDDSNGSRPAQWRRPSRDRPIEATSPRAAAGSSSGSYDGASRTSISLNGGSLSQSSSSSLMQAASVDVATFIDLVLAFRAYPQPLLNSPARAGETNYALTLSNVATKLSEHYLGSMDQSQGSRLSPGRYSGAILLQYVEDLICPSGAPGSSQAQPAALVDALRFMLVVEEARTAVLRGLPALQPDSAGLPSSQKQSTVLVAPKPRSRFFKAFSKDKSTDQVEFELCSPVTASFEAAAPQQTRTISTSNPTWTETTERESEFDTVRRVSEATIKVDELQDARGPQSDADEAIEDWSGRLQAALSGTSTSSHIPSRAQTRRQDAVHQPPHSQRNASPSSNPAAFNDPADSDSEDEDSFTDSSDQLDGSAAAVDDEGEPDMALWTQPEIGPHQNSRPAWMGSSTDVARAPFSANPQPALPASVTLPTIPRRRMSTGLPVIPPTTTPPPVPPLDARWKLQPSSSSRLQGGEDSREGSSSNIERTQQSNLDGSHASRMESSPPVPPKDVISSVMMTTTTDAVPRVSPPLDSPSEMRSSPRRRPISAYLDNATPPPIPRRMQSTVWAQPPDDAEDGLYTPTSLPDSGAGRSSQPEPHSSTISLRPSHHLDRQPSTDSNISSELPPYQPALPGRMASLPVIDATHFEDAHRTADSIPYVEYETAIAEGERPQRRGYTMAGQRSRSVHSSQTAPSSRMMPAIPTIPTRSRPHYPGNAQETDNANDDDDEDGEWVGTAEARRRSLLSFAQSQGNSPSLPSPSSRGMRASATAPSLYPTSWSRATPSPVSSPSRQPPPSSSRAGTRSPGLVVDWQPYT